MGGDHPPLFDVVQAPSLADGAEPNRRETVIHVLAHHFEIHIEPRHRLGARSGVADTRGEVQHQRGLARARGGDGEGDPPGPRPAVGLVPLRPAAAGARDHLPDAIELLEHGAHVASLLLRRPHASAGVCGGARAFGPYNDALRCVDTRPRVVVLEPLVEVGDRVFIGAAHCAELPAGDDVIPLLDVVVMGDRVVPDLPQTRQGVGVEVGEGAHNAVSVNRAG